MKSLDKLPTPENLDEVAQNDVLERNQFIANFIRLLASIEGHYSIALDGRWGSGKTFFVKQTERVIKEFYNVNSISKQKIEISFIERVKNIKNSFQKKTKENKKDESNRTLHAVFEKLLPLELNDTIANHMMTFYYDAWQHDSHQDALISLIGEILKNSPTINPLLNIKQPSARKIYDKMIVAAKGIANKVSGINFEEFNDIADEILQGKQKQEDLESFIKDFFENLIPDNSSHLVIFIDELDRCKPDYAVQLLERIKHYMLIDRITFVFSLNYDQLQHTIKRYYGDDFEASM